MFDLKHRYKTRVGENVKDIGFSNQEKYCGIQACRFCSTKMEKEMEDQCIYEDYASI